MVPLAQAKKIVIKLGTGILRTDQGSVNNTCIETICKEVAYLKSQGIDVILVSSGAVGLGMARLKIKKRPTALNELQTCAAIGQTQLINLWQNKFDFYNLTVAQILLTQEDLSSSSRHSAVINTIDHILSTNSIPVVNENDTVSSEEIKFGDNDTLSALVAKAIGADLLLILSNVSGLMDPNNGNEVISLVNEINSEIKALASGTQHEMSVGGMVSKLTAAKITTENNCGMFIGSGNDPELFQKILQGKCVGTYFPPSSL